jgi:metal-responsive CopG/Arc/MetJ family transcriptional regulator
MANKFDKKFQVRLDDDLLSKIDELEEKSSADYESRSHVIRCAIIKLHRMEV